MTFNKIEDSNSTACTMVSEGEVKYSENYWIMYVFPYFLILFVCNGPLISAHGRLNWSDKVRTGELIYSE